MDQQVLTSGRGSLLVEQGGLEENIQVYFVVLRIFFRRWTRENKPGVHPILST